MAVCRRYLSQLRACLLPGLCVIKAAYKPIRDLGSEQRLLSLVLRDRRRGENFHRPYLGSVRQ